MAVSEDNEDDEYDESYESDEYGGYAEDRVYKEVCNNIEYGEYKAQ